MGKLSVLAFSCTNLFGYMFNLASTCVRGIVHGCTLVRHGLLEIVSLSLLCIPVCRMRYLRCTRKPKQQVQRYCVINELGFEKPLQPNDLFVLVLVTYLTRNKCRTCRGGAVKMYRQVKVLFWMFVLNQTDCK